MVLSLKNGSTFHGYLMTDSIPELFIIYMSDTDSISIPYSQVTNVKYLENGKSRNYISVRRLFNVTEVGILFGKVNSDASISSSMTAQTTFGYSFNQYIKAGIGAGYDQYDGTYTLPVFFSLRGDLLKKMVSPVYFVNAGYAAAWGDESNWQDWAEVEGGKMIDGGLGMRVTSLDGYNLLLSIGYKIQDITYKQVNWEGEVSSITSRINRRLRFSIGIGF